jgi:hypothetical protein
MCQPNLDLREVEVNHAGGGVGVGREGLGVREEVKTDET